MSFELTPNSYIVLRKVRDNQDIDPAEQPIWWGLVREGYIEYLFQQGAWLTDKAKKALEEEDNREHRNNN